MNKDILEAIKLLVGLAESFNHSGSVAGRDHVLEIIEKLTDKLQKDADDGDWV